MRKLTYEEVKEVIENEGYELQSKLYINSKEKLSIKCSCGEVFEMSYNIFKKGHRCKQCSIKSRQEKRKHTFEYVKNYIEARGYKLLSHEYKNNNSKLQIVCEKGHSSLMTFGNFQRGRRCKTCSHLKITEKQRHDYTYVKSFVESIGYTLIDDKYVRNSNKLNLICSNNHKTSISFKNLRKGVRCSHCNTKSHGEERIKTFLNKKEIPFITQYKIEECKFKRQLPFDFYLPDYNVLIEYDGEQHYKIKEYFGGFDGFVDTKIRDTIKNIYCKENNIKLIRIPYWEFDNIEEILDKQIPR